MNILKELLKNKENELKRRQDHFKVFVESEINTGNFERNATSDLMIMLSLKSEIRQLKDAIIFAMQNKEIEGE